MKRVLLTSSGFENKRIQDAFLELAEKRPGELKALFIPTAAIDADAIAVLPKCINDLLHTGIPAENITVFDLHRALAYEELCAFDVVYFTGGSPQYLLGRIRATRFDAPLKRFVADKGVYVGVSAGSWIATNNLPDSLQLINCTLSVHMQVGTKGGPIDTASNPHIDLTGNNAILIRGDCCQVIE